MNRNFENLRIWQQAREMVLEIYHLCEDIHDYSFCDQLKRAAVSVMNNIAEGSEYESDATFVHFLRIAKGSCAEVKSMLYLCNDLNYCSDEKRLEFQDKLTFISAGIYNMIKSLTK